MFMLGKGCQKRVLLNKKGQAFGRWKIPVVSIHTIERRYQYNAWIENTDLPYGIDEVLQSEHRHDVNTEQLRQDDADVSTCNIPRQHV